MKKPHVITRRYRLPTLAGWNELYPLIYNQIYTIVIFKTVVSW